MTQAWPDNHVRRALVYVVILCATVVLGLGAAVYHTNANWSVPGDLRYYFLGIPVDGFPHTTLGIGGGTHLLVMFGEPPIFVASIIVLAAIALLRRDARVAFIAVAAPVTAEILTELIGKPFFDRTAGTYYTYPSGHVTATASIMAVAALLIRRCWGRRAASVAIPILGAVIVASIVGVIVLHMHDLIDATGGLAMAIGVVSAWTAVVLKVGGSGAYGDDVTI